MPLPREDFMVFISHATTEDGVLVERIAEALDRIHVRAYVFERYPVGGRNKFKVIKRMIEECPYFLVVLSEAGIASQWVNQEIGYAVGVGKNPIPVIEVDSTTGKRIASSGFVELNDPINYDRNDEVQLMADIVYTFHNLLLPKGKWKDSIYVRCKCGNEFDAPLNIDECWELWNKRPIEEAPEWQMWHQPRTWLSPPGQSPIVISCTCDNCQREVRVSFPDCHLLPQQ